MRNIPSHPHLSSVLGNGQPPHSGRENERSNIKPRQFSFESKHSRNPHVDPHISQVITDSYEILEKRFVDLVEVQLGRFVSECRQLGRSYALILATCDLREGLRTLLSKFRNNAECLISPSPDSGPPISANSPFPFWLEGVASVCDIFRERLNEFREYTDESAKIESLMGSFSKDLMYRAYCLKGYSADTLDTPYMRKYIHDLASEMVDDLDNLISAFALFNDYGVHAMQYEQKRDTDVLKNVSTVATFFSAVTATTLQISLQTSVPQEADSLRLLDIVNTFWFCSLVLSIGAAFNSVLAVVWKRTPYGSRGRRLPAWVTVWIHGSAPVFLSISIISFSAGLTIFVYATKQQGHTKIVTLATTAITSFGIITTIAWFAYEQWIAPLRLPAAPWRLGKRIHEWTQATLAEKNPSPGGARGAPTILVDHIRMRRGSLSDYSDGSLSDDSPSDDIPNKISARIPILSKVARLKRQPQVPQEQNQSFPLSLDIESQPVRPVSCGSSTAAEIRYMESSRLRSRWVRCAKLVTSLTTASKAFQGTPHTSPTIPAMSPTVIIEMPPASPFEMAIPDKPSLSVPLPASALQDIEYSPNGQYLAFTCSGSKSDISITMIYKTRFDYNESTSYTHHSTRVSKQIQWLPNNKKLLVRLDHSVDLLDQSCNLISTIKRPHSIESIVWLAQRNSFLSVEGSTVYELSTRSQVRAKFRFDNILLKDIAIVPGTNLLIATGRVMHPRQVPHSRPEIVPTNSRAEKQVILYDMHTKKYLSHYPILDDVRYIQVAHSLSKERDGFDILLSHKNGPAPRLWTLRAVIRGQAVLKPETMILQPSSELSGYGYYIGDEDQMIACVGPDGDIHTWDRESGQPLQRIRANVVERGMRCLAWRPRCTAHATFASVDEKELRIWIVEPPLDDSSSINAFAHHLTNGSY